MNRTLSTWQVEEIKKAIAEADRGKFASEQAIQKILQKWTSTSKSSMARNNQT
ncbi:MAG TPA: hypothetical protein VFR24_07750 [Candidatus Angelobacter sp.]|nr:hypothetical protein [Candidatus Angelobacter sp.]